MELAPKDHTSACVNLGSLDYEVTIFSSFFFPPVRPHLGWIHILKSHKTHRLLHLALIFELINFQLQIIYQPRKCKQRLKSENIKQLLLWHQTVSPACLGGAVFLPSVSCSMELWESSSASPRFKVRLECMHYVSRVQMSYLLAQIPAQVSSRVVLFLGVSEYLPEDQLLLSSRCGGYTWCSWMSVSDALMWSHPHCLRGQMVTPIQCLQGPERLSPCTWCLSIRKFAPWSFQFRSAPVECSHGSKVL